MSDTSGHNDSSFLREFSAEYELQRSQNKELADKLEVLNQENHSLRNRLQVAEKIQTEYQSELECQQQQFVEANDSHVATVLKLKEDHALIVRDFEDKVHFLENGLQEVEQKHAADKEELRKARKEICDLQDSSPVATLKVELQEIMEEHAANRSACVQHQDLNTILLQEKSSLLEDLSSTREHLEMTEEKLKICKADLMEQSETLEDLRESLAVAQNELACLKTGPADVGARGNSLFAEVEDNRQVMVKKCTTLSKRYHEMKRDYGAKCSEISKLKLENLQLRRKWQEEAEERDNRDVWLSDNYQIRIKELTKLVELLKKEERPVFVNGDSKILNYAEHFVKESRQELCRLREEMEWRSSERLNEAKALYLARSDVQILKAQVMSLSAENIVLRDKLDEANITEIPLPGPTLKRIKEALDKVNEITVFQTSSPTEEVSSSSEDTSQSQTAAQMNFPASSSMMVNIPKPKRLNDAEKIQLESNSDWIDKDQPQADNDLSVRGVEEMDLESKDTCVQEDETQEVELSKDIMEDKCTDGEHNNLTVSLPHSDSMERQQEDTNNHPPKPREAEEHVDFISQNLIETVSAAISEIHIKPDEESNVSPTAATEVLDENKPAFTFKAPSSEFYEHEQKNRSPRQSILCKARPSLVPIDQNAIVRKVRFADVNTSSISPVECESKCTEVLTESPKKKLVRVPQPRKYKTRIIVSKELD